MEWASHGSYNPTGLEVMQLDQLHGFVQAKHREQLLQPIKSIVLGLITTIDTVGWLFTFDSLDWLDGNE